MKTNRKSTATLAFGILVLSAGFWVPAAQADVGACEANEAAMPNPDGLVGQIAGAVDNLENGQFVPDANECAESLCAATAPSCTLAGEGEGAVMNCGTNISTPDVYVVKDRVAGVNFGVTVLYGLIWGGVRVAWSNQIAMSSDGVNVYVNTTDQEDDNSRILGWTASDNSITGECGEFIAFVGMGEYRVNVAFAGIDITETHTEIEVTHIEIHAEFEQKFSVNILGPAESASVKFGVSGGWQWENGDSMTYHGIRKEFGQTYSADALPSPSVDCGECMT